MPVLFVAAIVLILATGPAPAVEAADLLPPEEAFRLTAKADAAGGLELRWDIAEGYYLYRDRASVKLAGPERVTLGEPTFPPGKVKHDPYFGDAEVYYKALQAVAPLRFAGEPPPAIVVEASYQGCADAGLCYPPVTRTLTVALGGATSGGLPAAGAGSGSVTAAPEHERVAALLGEASLPWMVLSFAGFGLLLAFTPCVLPMVPILSGLIVGQGERPGWRRGLLLSVAYVLPMAGAYALFGILAGLAGQNLQAALQAPAAIVAFSIVFVALALSMFGWFELQVPSFIQSRLAALSNRRRGGTVLGAALMGFVSALIVGPCLTPPLAGALLYIGQTGNAALGGLALFALGLGMGLPLLAIGALGGRFLPKPGPWLERVKAAFGFVLLGVAVWMLARIVPPALTLALWAALLVGVAVTVGAFEPLPAQTCRLKRLAKGAGVFAAAWAATLLLGAAAGGADPLRPLAALANRGTPAFAAEPAAFRPIKTVAQLEAAVAEASRAGRATMVDFYADWCVSCKTMEREVFGDPRVQARLNRLVLLRPDVTAYDDEDRALMRRLNVIGPPTILFFARNGRELGRSRIVGEVDTEAFLKRIAVLPEGT